MQAGTLAQYICILQPIYKVGSAQIRKNLKNDLRYLEKLVFEEIHLKMGKGQGKVKRKIFAKN